MAVEPASIRPMVPTMDPVDQFRARLLSMRPGDWHTYHTGSLARDRARAPSLHQVAIIASGLQMLGAVVLRQTRYEKTGIFYYKLRTNRPIRNVDFDHGRKTYLENLKEE